MTPSKTSFGSLFVSMGSDMAFFTISIPRERAKFNIVVWDVDFNDAIWIERLQKAWGIFPKLSEIKLPEFGIKAVEKCGETNSIDHNYW